MGCKIFIIAGEASGDWIGSKLMRELKSLDADIEFSGIGGQHMVEAGLKTLFSADELSLMGFAEILPHIRRLKRLMRQTVDEIKRIKPDIVVTIDSPGFNMRIAERIQELRGKTKLVHYIAPTVWAYKEKRAKTVARLFDRLLMIYPFEAPYFAQENIDAFFVGHPMVEDGLDKGDAAAFRAKYKLADGEFICLMPGSRKGELKRMLPVYERAVEILEKTPVILSNDNMKFALNALTKNWKFRPIIADSRNRADCFAAVSAGIIKSGTAGLEFAFSGKPYVVTYKVNPLSAYMMRRMIKISYVNMVNILLNEEVVPELLQDECDADYIADNLIEAHNNPTMQVKKCAKAIAMLYPKGRKIPSRLAAERILELKPQN